MAAADGAQQWIGEAKQHLKDGRLEEAVASARKAVAVAPASGEAQFVLGAALCKQGHFDEGIVALAAAVESNPRSPAGWFNLALAYERAERWHSALQAWHEVLHLDPRNEKARAAIARVAPHATDTPPEEDPLPDDDGLLPMDSGHHEQAVGGYAPWEVGNNPPQPPAPPPANQPHRS